jgi:cardiolipin synthase
MNSTGESAKDREPILNIPNLLTLVRALGIPLFLWLYLRQHASTLSFVVLSVGALTDYLDGKLARLLNQETKLGAALDPAIDRAYIAATVLALAIKNIVPWWLVSILLARDIWMAIILGIKKRRTGQLFEVTYLGKAATFNLLYAFPFLLLSGRGAFGSLMHVLGWGFAVWGVGLYLFTALQYSSVALRATTKLKGN